MRTTIRLLGCAVLVLQVGTSTAHGAFPGVNGLLAFEREAPAGDHTQADIYTIAADGSGLSRLTSTRGRNEFGPAWNAAGTAIAFWRTPAPFGPGSVWVMDADGQSPRRLTTGFDARDPAWNRAGTQLVFTRADNFDLWTMRASDGADLHQLTFGDPLDFEAAWSPDGKKVAFTRASATGDAGDIYVLTIAPRSLKRLTHSADYDHQVSWGPGGNRLVFERDYETSSSVFRINADGSGLVRLTRGPFFDTGPAFAPDGDAVAFGTDRGGGFLDDLWVMSDSGTNLHRVRQLTYSESFPDWQAVP